jgi:hypothetical protein
MCGARKIYKKIAHNGIQVTHCKNKNSRNCQIPPNSFEYEDVSTASHITLRQLISPMQELEFYSWNVSRETRHTSKCKTYA